MKKTKSTKFKHGDLIMVEWCDITGNEGWVSLHQPLLEPVKVLQVGFFLSKNKKTLHITQGLADTGCETMGISAIPMGTVTSLRKLRG